MLQVIYLPVLRAKPNVQLRTSFSCDLTLTVHQLDGHLILLLLTKLTIR